MKTEPVDHAAIEESRHYTEAVEEVRFTFEFSRREALGVIGAGILIAAWARTGLAQALRGDAGGRRGTGGGGGEALQTRLHLDKDGMVTVLVGKVECGQGARAESAMAVAEELRIPFEKVAVIMADTALTPNDGMTVGSRTTPGTIPVIRQAAAFARDVLAGLAAAKLGVDKSAVQMAGGQATAGGKSVSYGDLAGDPEAAKALTAAVPNDVEVTAVSSWKVMGHSAPRPNARDIVTGKLIYPSDVVRPGMLYGKILRAPTQRGVLKDLDVSAVKNIEGVGVIRDGEFVGVVAKSTHRARQAIDALAKTAAWTDEKIPSTPELFDYLRERAAGGMPANPFADVVAAAEKKLRATFHVPYVQHAPMETRTATAEWVDGSLTVWTATQAPPRVRSELARALRISEERVRVIVPDFGGGFGGKHSGECAVEASRLAQGAGKPVCLRYSREEEFRSAYFRPAALIEAEASLDDGKISSWHFVNVLAGSPGIETPYVAGKSRSQAVGVANPPLRTGSYRGLAATANHFARECFMDELAALAGSDPLEFRLAHLQNERIRGVLQAAAKRFNWPTTLQKSNGQSGIGLACGTEKGSFIATCAEIAIDEKNALRVRRLAVAFDCGAIINPAGLRSQIEGGVIMALGPALREEIILDNNQVQNGSFMRYLVPRLEDVPQLEVDLVNRPNMPSVGAGETPLVCVAPAIANAVGAATGQRVRSMPIRPPARA